MYRSLLVPLDRSSFAEQALPAALSIARRAHARLDLVEVHTLYALDDAHAAWCSFEPDRDAERKQQEQLYLDATAKWLTSVTPVSASTGVLSGSTLLAATVADGILERAQAGNADLIVMATHGQGPLTHFGRGSVADELVRRAHVPVLLVRPSEEVPDIIPEPVLDNILIPLDGSALAEQVLQPTLELALLMGARCTLLRVIESRSSHSEAAGGDLPEREQAQAYLDRVAGRAREQGLQVGTRVVMARHAAEAIVQESDMLSCNLIALATHGRGGLKRLLLGSVAEKLVRDARLPVLVYCPRGTDL
jgi:nucleotide-binding universal stress UspA family protein